MLLFLTLPVENNWTRVLCLYYYWIETKVLSSNVFGKFGQKISDKTMDLKKLLHKYLSFSRAAGPFANVESTFFLSVFPSVQLVSVTALLAVCHDAQLTLQRREPSLSLSRC